LRAIFVSINLKAKSLVYCCLGIINSFLAACVNIEIKKGIKFVGHAYHNDGKLKAKEDLGETEVFCVFCSNLWNIG
jgi:hypothetical protein